MGTPSDEQMNHVASVVAWLRGQEWVGEKPTRGQSADALEALCARLAALEADARRWKSAHDHMVQRNAVLRERPDLPVDRLPAIAKYEGTINALQAQVDRLMLEYCPDEMSAEQIANWSAHQRAAPSEFELDVSAALSQEPGGK